MRSWQKALNRTAWVSAIFCLLVLAGLTANALIARAADPNPPTRIDDLATRLKLDPKNKTILQSLRRQDVWLREGYLRSQRFALMGGFLLLGGVAAFLLSFKGSRKLAVKAEAPDPSAPDRFAARVASAQQGTLTLGIVLGGGLAVLAVLSRHDAIAGYLSGATMPQAAAIKKGEEPKGEPIDVLPPPGALPAQASQPSLPSQPEPLQGAIPNEGTALVPMPVTAPPPAAKPAAPPKKVVVTPPVVAKGSWPLFRGPAASGVAAGSAPDKWNVLWKSAVPMPGNGSPVVWGGKVFLTGADEKTRQVYAFDTENGKSLWKTDVAMLPNSGPMKQSNDTGFAPATVAVDGKHVVASFVNGDVACLDPSGRLLWTLPLGKLDNAYGHASSPILVEGKLILQVDQGTSPEDGKSQLLAVNPDTGKALWSCPRPVASAWSTPLPMKVDGRWSVVTSSNPLTLAHDLTTGKVVWRAEGLTGDVAPSPACGEGLVFVGLSGASLLAFGAGDGKPAWTNSDVTLPDISSPVCANGIVFVSGWNGEVSAVDAKDGRLLWSHKFEKPARSSPVVVGGNVYLAAIDGTIHVFGASREFKLVDTHPMGEPVNSTPAFVDGRVYVRGAKSLICVGSPSTGDGGSGAR